MSERQQMTYCLGEPISLHQLLSDYRVRVSPYRSWPGPPHLVLAFYGFEWILNSRIDSSRPAEAIESQKDGT